MKKLISYLISLFAKKDKPVFEAQEPKPVETPVENPIDVKPIPSAKYTRDVVADLWIKNFEKYEGSREVPDGSNSGPVVSQIIKKAGGRVGEPWCADTVTCVTIDTCEELGIHYPKGLYRGASSQSVKNDCDKKYLRSEPDRGMAFVHSNVPADGRGHTGGVKGKIKNGIYPTIEGNRNNRIASYNDRDLKYAHAFVDYAQAIYDQYVLEHKNA